MSDLEFLGSSSRLEVGFENSQTTDFLIPFDALSTKKESQRIYSSLSLSLINSAGTGALNLTGRITFGDMDLSEDPNFASDAAGIHGNFTKLNIDISAQQKISPSSALTAITSCQLTNSNLDSSEEIGLSGPAAVRAYDVSRVNVDAGCVVQSEYVKTFSSKLSGFLLADFAFGRTHYKMFQGAKDPNNPVDNNFAISGIGFGARYSAAKNLNISFTYARRLGSCGGCTHNPTSERLWGVATVNF